MDFSAGVVAGASTSSRFQTAPMEAADGEQVSLAS